MPEESPGESSQLPDAEEKLLAGAEQRIARGMWVLGVVGMLVCWLWRDWSWGAGFATGAVISALNFHWLKGGVAAVAEAATGGAVTAAPGRRQDSRRGRLIARFVLRYALIGLAAYVIFRSSFVSLAAFFLGLFLVLAAILAEISYQVYCGFRNR